jgi:hypothetical protein
MKIDLHSCQLTKDAADAIISTILIPLQLSSWFALVYINSIVTQTLLGGTERKAHGENSGGV